MENRSLCDMVKFGLKNVAKMTCCLYWLLRRDALWQNANTLTGPHKYFVMPFACALYMWSLLNSCELVSCFPDWNHVDTWQVSMMYSSLSLLTVHLLSVSGVFTWVKFSGILLCDVTCCNHSPAGRTMLMLAELTVQVQSRGSAVPVLAAVCLWQLHSRPTPQSTFTASRAAALLIYTSTQWTRD